MSCRFGACEVNNNRPKVKKPVQKAKKGKSPAPKRSNSDWPDSESCSDCSDCWDSSSESCSGCSACRDSSSSCSCSECNMETDSSDNACYLSACGPNKKKTVKKPAKNNKVLQCSGGVCEWVPKKKAKAPAKKAVKPKKPAKKTANAKKKTPKSCYDCC